MGRTFASAPTKAQASLPACRVSRSPAPPRGLSQTVSVHEGCDLGETEVS